jgi:hypothetical protein
VIWNGDCAGIPKQANTTERAPRPRSPIPAKRKRGTGLNPCAVFRLLRLSLLNVNSWANPLDRDQHLSPPTGSDTLLGWAAVYLNTPWERNFTNAQGGSASISGD